jgi:hypothetical protein
MSSTARSTLACGAVAGPLFATVGLAQACSRAGFDSALIGALLVIGVGAISSGSPNATANLSFVTAALLGFLWVSALAARLRSEAEAPAPRRSPRSTGRKQASAPTAG